MRRVLGVVLVILGVPFLGLGVLTAALTGPDDTVRMSGGTIATDAPAITTAADALPWSGPRYHVRAYSGDVELFVGVAHPVNVGAYLDGVAQERVEEITPRYGGPITSSPTSGDVTPTVAPGELDWWTDHAEGSGEQTVSFQATETPASVVVLRADLGSPLDVDLSVDAEIDGLFVGALGAAVGGVVLILAGRSLVRSRRRRRGRGDDVPPSRYRGRRQRGRRAARGTTGRRRRAGAAAFVATVSAVALTGCATPPRPLDIDDPSTMVAATHDQAKRFFTGYNDALDAAATAQDASALDTVATGSALAMAAFGVDAQKATQAQAPQPATATPAWVAAPELEGYPLWFVASTDSGNGTTTRYVVARDEPTTPWRAVTKVELAAGMDAPAPTTTEGVATVATGPAVERGGPILTALLAYAESGTAPEDVDVTAAGDLANLHTQGYSVAETGADFGTQTRKCVLADTRAVHWLTSDAGAVTIASITCTQVLALAPGYWFTTPEAWGTIPGGVDLVSSTISQTVSFVLEVADDGTATVVGSPMRPVAMTYTAR